MIIDLRSDTVTKPSKEMLEVMIYAQVGDDVYFEDDSVNELQQNVANLLGKEAALFVPSGTMSNQIALAINTSQGDEILCEKNSHIFYYETAAPSIISKVQIRTFDAPSGVPTSDQLESKIRDDIYYYPNTTLLCLENTHNRYGGLVLNNDKIKEIRQFTQSKNIKMHLDGARLWNASIYSGVSLKEYSNSFDTISLCFSKGLGAPIGSILVGSDSDIKKALKWRKILGGGMRQVGLLAAACSYAIDNNFKLLEKDHINTKNFALKLEDLIVNKFGKNDLFLIKNEIQTNILVFGVTENINFDKFVENIKSKGIKFNTLDSKTLRLVFHLDISESMTNSAVEIFFEGLISSIRK